MSMRLGTLLARRHRRTPATAPTLTVSPFFYAHAPSSGEGAAEDRNPRCFFWTTNTVNWTWRFADGFTPTLWPSVRALVDGAPASAWISPATNDYPFSLTVANGHHILSFEIQSRDPAVVVTNRQVMARDFVVNASGSPLSTQSPWTAVNRFERTFGFLANGHEQVTYPGSLPTPTTYPLKARTIEHHTTLLSKDQQWVRSIHANNGQELTRRFVALPTGDVAVEPDQKYTYASYTGTGAGLTAPQMTLRDGPRYVGTVGTPSKAVVRSGGQGYYMADPNGRLSQMTTDGTVSTIVGWRVKPGMLKAHGGIRGSTYMYGQASADYRPDHQAFYDARFEYLGNWNVPDLQRAQELRGFAVAKRNLDTSIDATDGREFWVCDTLNNRLLYVNARTMDAPEDYEAAHFPPPGYVSPASPTGVADVMVFSDGDPAGDEPWDAAVNPADGKLYWTCFATGRIMRRSLDGSALEVVLQTAVNPTNAQLGAAGGRLSTSSTVSIAQVRTAYLIDGPIGTATCVRPQAIGFTSDGKLIWAERYTYAIRQLDLSTGQVLTLSLIPGGGSSDVLDIGMSIDVGGTCGPQDDIFINAYQDTDYRFSKTGVLRGRWAWTSGATMQNGPLDLCEAPGHAFCVAVGDGRIMAIGSATGSQCIEITKRQPEDVAPDQALWEAGRDAYYLADPDPNQTGGPPMALLHGPRGQGELGQPTIEALGVMNDAALDAYALSHHIPSGSLAAFRHFVRHNTADLDFTVAPPASGEFVNFLLWDDGAAGPKRGTFSHQLSLHWKYYELTDERGGDWIDATGAEQGAVPFSTFTVAAATPAGFWLDVDVTTLVQKWKTTGKNKGFRIYPSPGTSSSANVTFSGRLGTNPPQLVINGSIVVAPGMLCSWAYTSLSGTNTQTTCRLAKNSSFLGRFDDLMDAISAVTVTSATLRMFVTSKSMSFPMVGEVYETNPPEIWIDPGTPTLGLASAVGEANLPTHSDVYAAGDFRQTNLWGFWPPESVESSPTKANRTNPTPLFNTVSIDTWGEPNAKMTLEFIDDPVVAGTQQVRFGWAPGNLAPGTPSTSNVGAGSQKLDLSQPLWSDPLLPADPTTMPQEMYCRIYVMLEDTFYDLYEDNIKWGIGWLLQLGSWDSNSVGWTPIAGNGQTAGDGRRYLGPDAFYGGAGTPRYYYRGHTIRSYTGYSCRVDNGPLPWRNLIAWHQAISHNGPYLHAGRYGYAALSGTEESQRIGNLVPGRAVVIKKDVWYCYEQYIKMNTLTGEPDSLGNMTANNDGELKSWLNGFLIDHKTGLSWRRHPDMGVQGPWIQCYHGGGIPPGHRGYFRYNHLVVAKQYIGPHPGRLG